MDPYQFSIDLVMEAGAQVRRARSAGFEVMSKGGDPRDIVTNVDKDIHELVAGRIAAAFPGHRVYSEEGEHSAEGAYVWTIDPIDGSSNFSRGIPHFAVCVGLLQEGEPAAGAVYNPVTNELFSFRKGGGAFLNGEPIRVSERTDLATAHVLFHAGRKAELRDWGGESYRRLLGSAKKTSNPSASSLDTCFVAAGRVEANIYGTLSTLDIAPAIGLLKEAGGVLSDREGGVCEFSTTPKKIYMANSQHMLEAVRTLLEG